MESIQYEWDGQVSSAEERFARLKKACTAFLLDASSRKDIRAIGLIVDVSPLVCAVLASTISRERKGDRRSRARRTAAQRQEDRLLAFEASTSRVATALAAARQDANTLSTWIATEKPWSSAPNDVGAAARIPVIPVLVIAHLSPQSWPELELYRTWQGQEHATVRSPLRYAAAVSVQWDHMAPQWAARPSPVLSAAGASDRGTPAMRELDELLLPHQQLLLDFTWALLPPFLSLTSSPNHHSHALYSGGRSGGEGGHNKESSPPRMGKPAMTFAAFFDVILPQLVAPKGRCGILVRYHRLLSFLSPSRVNSLAGSTADFQDTNDDDEASRVSGGVDCQALLAVQRQFQRILEAVYHGNGAIGKNCVLRWIVSFGGPVDALLQTSETSVEDGEVNNGFITTMNPHRTRRLRDAHALVSLLMGEFSGATGFEAAAQFCRRLLTRVDRSGWLSRPALHSACHTAGPALPPTVAAGAGPGGGGVPSAHASVTPPSSQVTGARAFLGPLFADSRRRSTSSLNPGTRTRKSKPSGPPRAFGTGTTKTTAGPADHNNTPHASHRKRCREQDEGGRPSPDGHRSSSLVVEEDRKIAEHHAQKYEIDRSTSNRAAKRQKLTEREERSGDFEGLWTTDLNPTKAPSQ